MDSLLSRLAERPRVWPSQQEWMLAELALLIERSDRLNLQRVHAALAPDARLGRPGATRLLLDLVHESIPPAAMISAESLAQQEKVAAQACRVLYGMLTGGHKGLHAAAVDGGVVPLMPMVLMVAADAATHVWALSTLGVVLRGSSSSSALTKAATDAGAAAATLHSLRTHPASAEVQQRGIEVFAALVVDGGAPACAALRAGCVDAAASALRHGRYSVRAECLPLGPCSLGPFIDPSPGPPPWPSPHPVQVTAAAASARGATVPRRPRPQVCSTLGLGLGLGLGCVARTHQTHARIRHAVSRCVMPNTQCPVPIVQRPNPQRPMRAPGCLRAVPH